MRAQIHLRAGKKGGNPHVHGFGYVEHGGKPSLVRPRHPVGNEHGDPHALDREVSPGRVQVHNDHGDPDLPIDDLLREKLIQDGLYYVKRFDTIKIAGEYLAKGKTVYIEGRLQTRKWQDRDGKDRYTTEIVGEKMQMLSAKGEGGGRSAGARPEGQEAPSYEEPAFNPDDDIPF